MPFYISSNSNNLFTQNNFCDKYFLTNDWGGYCEATRTWLPCKNNFCNRHGYKNRGDLADLIILRLAFYTHFHHMTIHYGEVITLKQQQQIYTQFKKMIFNSHSKCDMVKVNHWKKGRINNNCLFQHHHIILASLGHIPRRELKALLTASIKKCGLTVAPRLRMGYKPKSTCSDWCVYCLYLGKFKNRLVRPPQDLPRWELCRLGKKRNITA